MDFNESLWGEKKAVLHEHTYHETRVRRSAVPQTAASYRHLAAHAELRSPNASAESTNAASAINCPFFCFSALRAAALALC